MHCEINKDLFEGLYLAARERGDDSLKAELAGVGYDVDDPQPRYPVATFRAALGVVGRRLHPELSPEEAEQRVGALTVEGFFQTFTGKVLGMTLPHLGPRGMLRCYPQYARLGGAGFVARVEERGPEHWTVELLAQTLLADFMMGVLGQGLRYCGVEPTVTVLDRGASRLVLEVRWSPRG